MSKIQAETQKSLGGEEKNMKVHSDKKRKPRYYTTDDEGKLLFEDDDGATVLQWAIDYASEHVVVSETIELKTGFPIQSKKEPVTDIS